MKNPFFYGPPVPPDQFIGREWELRRITSRIVSQGQSTAIVGEPRIGKTSLLLYLFTSETQTELYGDGGKRLLFSFLDAHKVGGEFSQAQFWERALYPFYEQVIAPNHNSPLALAYSTCKENAFGTFEMGYLLAQMRADGWRLILLLDEFDVLLHHQALNNNTEFFSSLRSLTSLSQGALTLVIASRQLLTVFNSETYQFNPGSPYFNIFSEITLGVWSNAAIEELLLRAGNRFTADDQHFIKQAAGGHPYLLQVAAYELWDAYENGEEKPHLRRHQAWERLLSEVTQTLDDTWRIWSPATRQALAAVALANFPRLLKQKQHEFYQKDIVRDLHNLGPELRSLKKQGFVAEDKIAPGGWRVRPQVLLGWLADVLVRAVRNETSFQEWVPKHKLGFLLTRGRKEPLSRAIFAAGELLKGTTEAAAQGAGTVIGKAMVGGI